MEKPSSDILFLFTASFPYGKIEPFLENEIAVLAQQFKHIHIYPANVADDIRPVPDNCKVITNPVPFNSKKVAAKHALTTLRLMRVEEVSASNPKWFKANKREVLNTLLQALHRTAFIQAETKKLAETPVYYSFWMNNWALALSLLARKEKIKSYTCRVNGFDLFDDRRAANYIPFKAFNMEWAGQVITTSKNAKTYLDKSFPQHAQKVHLSYLGVNDNGTNPWNVEEPFVLVSCSWMVPVKRVTIIPDILKALDFPVKWIHIGNGVLSEEVREKCEQLPGHIETELLGVLANQKIMQLYREQPIHLFALLSSSEGGAPVALQEAISFGIPVLGSAAGGIPEVVNKETGMLVPLEFGPEQIAEKISAFRNSEMNSEKFRTQVKAYWQNHFDATNNYEQLAHQLKKNEAFT